MKTRWLWLMAALLALGGGDGALAAERAKKIVLIGGPGGQPPGEKEYNAGVLLLQKSLGQIPGVLIYASLDAWPSDPKVFDGAATVLFYFDGGASHALLRGDRMKTFGKLMSRGVGFVCLRPALDVPKEAAGEEFKQWLGGYFEDGYSVAPVWNAEMKALPLHPVCNGVQSFAVRDEWGFNIRFRDRMSGVTPILYARPSDEARQAKPAYPHVVEQSGRAEIIAWVADRMDGGRSFGFTGGHFHKNWADENFRKLVLNAIVWTARMDVPRDGWRVKITPDDLKANVGKK
ncbi:MAG TPA: ThuA domain-containing protein [Verrucomicrobiae bacterium]